MDWSQLLEAGESLRWQGRPAPRCWTFRNWRHACFGALVLVFSLWWQISGLSLAQDGGGLWPALLPIPFVLAAAYLAVGHLLVARWEWRNVCYAVSDRRILATRGLLRQQVAVLPLSALSYFQVVPHGEHLATLRLHAASLERWCVLHCIEHPELVTPLLAAVVATYGNSADDSRGEIV
jgi:hypothetical protein